MNNPPSFLQLPHPTAPSATAASVSLPPLPTTVAGVPPAATASVTATTTTPSADDEEQFTPDPLITAGPTALEEGSFTRFYSDQRALEPKHKYAYIVLMMADLHNAKLKTAYHDLVNETLATGKEVHEAGDPPILITPKNFAASHEVYETFMAKKGNQNKIKVTKAMIFSELKRRVPDIQAHRKSKVNMNNTTIEQLMDLLTRYHLTSDDDISFIENEFMRHEAILERACMLEYKTFLQCFPNLLTF